MDSMNPVIAFAASITFVAAYDPGQYSFWDRMAERWGIGLVGLVACFLLARWTMKREERREAKKEENEKEEKIELKRREDEMQAERTRLLAENNRLTQELLTHLIGHAKTLEQITKDGNKAMNSQAEAMKNLIRKLSKRLPDEPDT